MKSSEKLASDSHVMNDKYMADFEEALGRMGDVKIQDVPSSTVDMKILDKKEYGILGTEKSQSVSENFKKGPIDPSGFQYKISDRNLFCMVT